MKNSLLLVLVFSETVLTAAPPTQSGSPITVNGSPDGVGSYGWHSVPTAGKYLTVSLYARVDKGLHIALKRGSKYYAVSLGGYKNSYSSYKAHTTITLRDSSGTDSTLPFWHSSGVSKSIIGNDPNEIDTVSSSTYYYYQVIADRGTIHMRYYDPSTSQYVLLFSVFDEDFDDANSTIYTDYSIYRGSGTIFDVTNVSALSSLPIIDWDPIPGEPGNYQYVSGHAGSYYYKPGTTFNNTDSQRTSTAPLTYHREWDYREVSSLDTRDQKWLFYDSTYSPLGKDLGSWFHLSESYFSNHSPGNPKELFDRDASHWRPSYLDADTTGSLKNSRMWDFDSSTLSWSHINMGLTWRYLGSNQLLCTAPGFGGGTKSFTWTYHEETDEWSRDVGSNKWRYNERQVWIKTNADTIPSDGAFTERWYDRAYQSSAVWVGLGKRPNQNLLESFSHINENVSGTEYRSTPFSSPGQWMHVRGPSASPSNYILEWDPTVGSHGIWANESVSFGYDQTKQKWVEDTTAEEMFFYPYLPPGVVQQQQHFITAFNALATKGIVSVGPVTEDWTNNGRTNEFHLDVAYDTTEETAPLRITTSGPSTQLLHDLTHNPVSTSVGKWQHKDTTNSHEWNFDPASGIWRNVATEYQWQFSDLNPGQWSDSFDGTTWAYDENINIWKQVCHEG